MDLQTKNKLNYLITQYQSADKIKHLITKKQVLYRLTDIRHRLKQEITPEEYYDFHRRICTNDTIYGELY